MLTLCGLTFDEGWSWRLLFVGDAEWVGEFHEERNNGNRMSGGEHKNTIDLSSLRGW